MDKTGKDLGLTPLRSLGEVTPLELLSSKVSNSGAPADVIRCSCHRYCACCTCAVTNFTCL